MDYLKFGKIGLPELCEMSISQGAGSPSFFASLVVDYILYRWVYKVYISVDNVPNMRVRQKLELLQGSSNAKTFKQLTSFTCLIRFKAGYTSCFSFSLIFLYLCNKYTPPSRMY